MSFTELLQELHKLSPEELEKLQYTLDEMRSGDGVQETPELLAAVDEGIRSAEEEPLIPLEDVIEEIKSWNIKSS